MTADFWPVGKLDAQLSPQGWLQPGLGSRRQAKQGQQHCKQQQPWASPAHCKQLNNGHCRQVSRWAGAQTCHTTISCASTDCDWSMMLILLQRASKLRSWPCQLPGEKRTPTARPLSDPATCTHTHTHAIASRFKPVFIGPQLCTTGSVVLGRKVPQFSP